MDRLTNRGTSGFSGALSAPRPYSYTRSNEGHPQIATEPNATASAGRTQNYTYDKLYRVIEEKIRIRDRSRISREEVLSQIVFTTRFWPGLLWMEKMFTFRTLRQKTFRRTGDPFASKRESGHYRLTGRLTESRFAGEFS